MEIDRKDGDRALQVRVPFLNKQSGLGDAVAKITEAFGVKPCKPCEERKKRMNQRVQFRPWDT